MKINRTKKGPKEIKPIKTAEFDTFRDQYDVYKQCIKVHDNTLEGITADLTLAKFDEVKDKIYIIDMVTCAQQCKEVSKGILINWDEIRKDHPMIPDVTTEERILLENEPITMHRRFLIRIGTLSVVSRNKENNWLLKSVTNQPQTEDPIIETKDEITKGMERAKEKFRNEEDIRP